MCLHSSRQRRDEPLVFQAKVQLLRVLVEQGGVLRDVTLLCVLVYVDTA